MQIKAIVFPGQGSQRMGMGIDFYDQYPVAKRIFETASETLDLDIEKICRNSDPRINLTEFTQPCLLTAEVAIHKVLKHCHGVKADYYAGHSLGEYSALVAADAIPFETAIRLVHIRGKLMQLASPIGLGGMTAVTHSEIELPHKKIFDIATRSGVEIANDNSSKQLVLSGESKALQVAEDLIRNELKMDGLRIIPLNTSAPFHSRHMLEAQNLFKKAIQALSDEFKPVNASSVLSNYTGKFYKGTLEDLQQGLINQISGRVRWRENMNCLNKLNATIIEVGPTRVLSSFFKSEGKDAQSVVDLRSEKRFLDKLKEVHPLSESCHLSSQAMHAHQH